MSTGALGTSSRALGESGLGVLGADRLLPNLPKLRTRGKPLDGGGLCEKLWARFKGTAPTFLFLPFSTRVDDDADLGGGERGLSAASLGGVGGS